MDMSTSRPCRRSHGRHRLGHEVYRCGQSRARQGRASRREVRGGQCSPKRSRRPLTRHAMARVPTSASTLPSCSALAPHSAVVGLTVATVAHFSHKIHKSRMLRPKSARLPPRLPARSKSTRRSPRRSPWPRSSLEHDASGDGLSFAKEPRLLRDSGVRARCRRR